MKKSLLVLLVLCWSVSAQAATRVFFDGFEDGTTNAWTQDDYRLKCDVVSSALDGGAGPTSGTKMTRCNWDGTVAWNDPLATKTMYKAGFPYTSDIFLRAMIRYDNDADAKQGSKLMRVGNEGASFQDCQLELSPPQVFMYWQSSGAQVPPTYWGGAQCRPGWKKWEIYIHQAASGGIIRVWIDDVQIYDTSGNTIQTGGWNKWNMLSNWSNNPGWEHDANNHVYWDDVEIFSDATSGTATTGSMSAGTIAAVTGPDTTPPTVSSVTPTNGATGIALTTTVTATMSEDLDAATVTTSTVELRNPSNTLITSTVSESAGIITLNPNASLLPSTVYTAKVIGGSSGVKDVAGNALATTFTWSFTTVAPDTTPPTVSGVNPANSATNISTTIAPTITFSEPMDPATISTSTIDLKSSPGAVLVPSTVSYNATTRVATLTPNVPLALATGYTLRAIGGGSGVKDVAGNALASTQSASFTTTSSTSDTTLGQTTIGAKMDDGDANYMNGSRIVTVTGGTVASMSVYIGAIDGNTANRSYQFGIYTHNAGTNKPDTLVASTTSGTLTANSWNTLPITATLNPATTYWLLYNTNGLSSAVNNMAYNTTSAGQGVYSTGNMTFGTWPGTFPASTLTTTTYSLYVTFAPPPPTTFTLTVSKAGTGGGTITSSPGGISCGSDCTEAYSGNTVVTLTPTPDGTSTFIGWTGDSDCSDGTVTMDATKNCLATFNTLPPSTFNLTISKAGTGTGTVSGTGITCGSDCTETYPTGTVVELSSTADATSTFTGYTGTGCTTGSITMDSSKACVANFVLKPPPIISNSPVCIRVQ
jgi:hypothetical protein